MIRYSKIEDLDDIIKLWNEAFGDSESDIMFFINEHYKAENTLVYEENGVVVSMLFLLEGEMQISGKLYPSYYLYAACTLNRSRGKGYMSLLLDFAKETAQKRGYDYICLLPAEESLYKYYEKFGYKTVFKNKVLYFSKDDIKHSNFVFSKDIPDIESLRNKAFSECDYFKWSNSAIDFAFRHTEHYGGKALSNCKGYFLYSINGDALLVKECTFTDKMREALSLISSVDKIVLNLPCNFEIESSKYEIVNHGMILSTNEKAKEKIMKIDNAYLGLTLD